MKMIRISLCMVMFLLGSVAVGSLNVFADEMHNHEEMSSKSETEKKDSANLSTDNLIVKNVKRLEYSMPKNAPADLINLYLKAGWEWNKALNYMFKDVLYEDETVNINGIDYVTDEDGEVSTKISVRSGSSKVEVSSDNYDTNPVSITAEKNDEPKQVSVKPGEQKEVVLLEEINLDTMIDRMDEMNGQKINTENTLTTDKFIATPLGKQDSHHFEVLLMASKNGETVTCNRYNGPWGNNTYYSKTANPVMAARNFLWSDCDQALVWHVQCLKDYGPAKYRYCAWDPTTKRGKCSGLIGHSKKFHKH
ncbi:hypothetical protein HCJ82_07585 [Listeria booriae]|uniref:hypothetical protein n=1 Tax=Listeria booriae TaxID=1552123 RepID=UPI0016269A6E|nr:hypothetical protein [Listeria booriae]MBC2180005.1 hypothetical protein [Listeria booriae]